MGSEMCIRDSMFSDCGDDSGGKVMVRNTMVPRGREVKAREWKQLDKRTGVRFYPLVQVRGVRIFTC